MNRRSVRSNKVQSLSKKLTSKHKKTRANAAHALGIVGEPCAIPILLKTFEQYPKDDDLRCSIVRALGRIGGSLVVHPLLEVIRLQRGPMRKEALQGLGRQWCVPEAVGPLCAWLKEERGHMRLQITRTLGQIGSPGVVPVLLDLFHGADAPFKNEILTTFGRLGTRARAATPLLIRLFTQEKNAQKKLHLLGILCSLKSEEAIPVLVKELTSTDDVELQRKLLDTLRCLHTGLAPHIHLLVPFLQSRDLKVRENATFAITLALPASIHRHNPQALVRLQQIVDEGEKTFKNQMSHYLKQEYYAISKQLEAPGKRLAFQSEQHPLHPLKKPMLQVFLKDLKESWLWTKEPALKALGNMGTAASKAVPQIVEELYSSVATYKALQFQLTQRQIYLGATYHLQYTSSQHLELQQHAFHALYNIGSPLATAALILSAQEPAIPPQMRSELDLQNESTLIATLLKGLDDKESNKSIFKALQLRSPTSVDSLQLIFQALRTHQPPIQKQLLKVLGNSTVTDPQLQQGLKDMLHTHPACKPELLLACLQLGDITPSQFDELFSLLHQQLELHKQIPAQKEALCEFLESAALALLKETQQVSQSNAQRGSIQTRMSRLDQLLMIQRHVAKLAAALSSQKTPFVASLSLSKQRGFNRSFDRVLQLIHQKIDIERWWDALEHNLFGVA